MGKKKTPEKWGGVIERPEPQRMLHDDDLPRFWESVENLLDRVRDFQQDGTFLGNGVLTSLDTSPVERLWDAMRHLGGEGMPIDPTGRLHPRRPEAGG